MPTAEIVGTLSVSASNKGFYQHLHSQTKSWEDQIELLKKTFIEIQSKNIIVGKWHILLEFEIPRRGKRIDAVLLTEKTILILEFKCGEKDFNREGIDQVEDYCLDLRDFHLESKGLVIVPILVATHADVKLNRFDGVRDLIAPTVFSSGKDLAQNIIDANRQYLGDKNIDANIWNISAYNPTPTIIQSAQYLYSGQNVQEISRCSGGVENLTLTSEAVIRAIQKAKDSDRKLICFITGVPGAGKTLAGLNIVHNHSLHKDDLGVFLSGNGPLVKVLQEALARNYKEMGRKSLKEARRQVSTFIQNVHRFLDEYFEDKEKVPIDKVIVFDEAQRAWDRDQSNKKFKRNISEPELMLEIMNRHNGWAVLVCLVGGGQEINTGEAGLGEWGRALKNRFNNWFIQISPELVEGKGVSSQGLFDCIPENLEIENNKSLHLAIPLRSYRAEQVSAFVEKVLSKDSNSAKDILKEMSNYPICRTRDFDKAKEWLKSKQRGTRRVGIIATSGARRLRAYGIDVTSKVDVAEWFLNPKGDVRSSYSLETVCSEFEIQGLELDWTCLCWGGDLTPNASGWNYRSFRGTKWQWINQESRKNYTLNKYRVLLTRAREGSVIWVPRGDDSDPTRLAKWYDSIDEYLDQCGVPELLI